MRECVGVFQFKYFFEGDKVLLVEAFKKEVQRRKEEPGFVADSIKSKYLGTVTVVNKSSEMVI